MSARLRRRSFAIPLLIAVCMCVGMPHLPFAGAQDGATLVPSPVSTAVPPAIPPEADPLNSTQSVPSADTQAPAAVEVLTPSNALAPGPSTSEAVPATEAPAEENAVFSVSTVIMPNIIAFSQDIPLKSTSSALKVVSTASFCDASGQQCGAEVAPEGVEPVVNLACANAVSGRFEYVSSSVDDTQEVLISPKSVDFMIPEQIQPSFICTVWTRDYLNYPIQIK